VVDALVAAYYGRLRRPARTVYVLDSSGSMAGPRLTALKAALDRLAAPPAPGSSSAARFQEREQATLLPFRDSPERPTTFVLPDAQPEPTLRRIRTFTTTLRADGGTGIYAALAEAYRIAERQTAAEPDRITTIVLLTDGENTTGPDLAAFGEFHRDLPASVASVPVFPVLFGESDVAQMRKVATVTGGRVFDARRDPLDEVFARIRADQ
jgi:Ca-activated chloride channel family protein